MMSYILDVEPARLQNSDVIFEALEAPLLRRYTISSGTAHQSTSEDGFSIREDKGHKALRRQSDARARSGNCGEDETISQRAHDCETSKRGSVVTSRNNGGP